MDLEGHSRQGFTLSAYFDLPQGTTSHSIFHLQCKHRIKSDLNMG